MNTVAILGCGWLGMPLAARLAGDGYEVRGATTSESKIEALASISVLPFVISVSPEGIQGPVQEFLKGCDILIITIPPGKAGRSYSESIRQAAIEAKAAGIEKIIFTSSISVYPNERRTYSETDELTAHSPAAVELLASENIIRDMFPKATILRLGGLTGGDRQPAKYVGQSRPAEHPNAPINLVHLDDCVEIIRLLIRHSTWGEIFNIVAPFHPTRKDYYSQKAQFLNLPVPRFADAEENAGKTISSARIISTLNYRFRVTSEL